MLLSNKQFLILKNKTGGVLKCPAEAVKLLKMTFWTLVSLTQFALLDGDFLTLSAAVHVCLNHCFINKKHFG